MMIVLDSAWHVIFSFKCKKCFEHACASPGRAHLFIHSKNLWPATKLDWRKMWRSMASERRQESIEAEEAMSMSSLWPLLVIEVMSERAGIADAPGRGVVAAFQDLDRGDRPDIFVANNRFPQ
jgi:hypothetical protein